MKKSEKLKILLLLGIIEIKFNIDLNKLTERKTKNSIIFLDLILI